MCKFTITHPSMVAIITVTHVHEETSQVSELRVLQNSRVLRKIMPHKQRKNPSFLRATADFRVNPLGGCDA